MDKIFHNALKEFITKVFSSEFCLQDWITFFTSLKVINLLHSLKSFHNYLLLNSDFQMMDGFQIDSTRRNLRKMICIADCFLYITKRFYLGLDGGTIINIQIGKKSSYFFVMAA